MPVAQAEEFSWNTWDIRPAAASSLKVLPSTAPPPNLRDKAKHFGFSFVSFANAFAQTPGYVQALEFVIPSAYEFGVF